MNLLSSLLILFQLLFIINDGLQAETEADLKELAEMKAIEYCRNRQKLITSNRNEDFDLVETRINSTLSLDCHFCDGTDDNNPKMWYRQSRFRDSNASEVELGMEDELESNRVYMKPDHTLVFNQITEEDAALYYCFGPGSEDGDYKFSYLVDIVDGSKEKLTVGNIKEWSAIQKEALVKINTKFEFSNRSDYSEIRSAGILIEVIPRWQAWGPCDGCRKQRMRISECHLEPSILGTNITGKQLTDNEVFLIKSFEMSCYSKCFQKLYPNISTDLEEIGNFGTTETCYAPCKVNIQTNSSVRYKNTIVLTEGEDVKLTCPEVNLQSEVMWEKNGAPISQEIHGGSVIIDAFSNLYIVSASKDEEAIYTCFVDNIRMQQLTVFVRKQVMTTAAFFRHFTYLGFIFLFSGIFYGVGLVLVWNRRHTFKKIDFDNIAEEKFARFKPYYDEN